MNRHDIQVLQQMRGPLSISIMLPTHRTSPDNKQDPIRLTNLVGQASKRLLEEFSRRQVDSVLTRLEKEAQAIDHENNLDGLALFANQDFAHFYRVPFRLQERVVIGDNFQTRDLVFALNRTPRYWVLALSEQPTRLFEGTRDTLIEIREEGFPMEHVEAGGASNLPGGQGVSRSAYRDEYHRQFFRNVDGAFANFYKDDPLPLALVGIERYHSFFNEVSAHVDQIVGRVTGNHDKTSAHDLGRLVWPEVKKGLAAQRQQYLDELGAAVGAQRSASGLGEVWRFAQDGRVSLLLVEEGYHQPAKVDDSGRHLTEVDDNSPLDVMDDAVDDLIEAVLDKGGRVRFVEPGQLDKHQQIAAVLRY
jgi:hypothetical protein